MNNGFEFWKMCFDFGAIEINMLKKAVELNDLKAEEFKLITGEAYKK